MTKTVGIVLFPGVEELDFVGPYEVFGGLTFQDRDWRVITIAEAGTALRLRTG